MSKEAFREFLRKIRQDAGLQKEIRARFGDAVSAVPVGELAQFAAGKGYTFTVEELSGELSDDQLGAVSGGVGGAGMIFPKVEGVGMTQKYFVPLAPLLDKF
ncbi:MAG TPA: Nif11-like leader peptide family natural product precursor [Thermoanaerobaculia bacterium]|nr:Nif11-like leader peptide family natural product precursor [Thermoanaerobaculia bacterium]HQR66537.1 Nif11-like leader peptide family natural product precursor [Thermoanaerobaculia bacterium]